jgi:hypothetical protein
LGCAKPPRDIIFFRATWAVSGITGLLKAWAGGDAAALERLMLLVYEELRRRARRYMAFSNFAPEGELFISLSTRM